MIKYAKENGIEVAATSEKPYSTDENLMHISYESGILEDPNHNPDEDMFKLTSNDSTPFGELTLMTSSTGRNPRPP